MDKKEKKPQSGTSGTILSAVLSMALGAGVAYALPENESFFAVFLFGLAGFCVSFALQTILPQMKDSPSVLRTEYALALLHDGDKERAALLRGRFEKIAAAYPYQGDIEQERSLLALTDGKIQNIG